MTGSPHVAALGAVDRFNYGDLLFPLVLKGAMQRFEPSTEVRAYGVVERALHGTGALPTRSYRDLVKGARSGEIEAIVVVGGEVVGAEWTTMATHLGSRAQERAIRLARKVLGRRFANRAVAALLGGDTVWPWVFAPDELGTTAPVIYNAVGGASSWQSLTDRQRRELAAAIERASYVSVRDPVTQGYLRSAGVGDVHLSPDSAIVMADLWPREQLKTSVRPELRDLPTRAPYVAVQTNWRIGARIGGELARQAQGLALTNDLRILPLPIGRVAGHDDAIALRPVAAIEQTISVPDDLNVWEIMHLIAGSRLFVGTSLHGSITALSYGTPHLALTDGVPKLNAHLQAWSDPRLTRPADVTSLSERAAEAMAVPSSDLESRASHARTAAWENLRLVCRAATRTTPP